MPRSIGARQLPSKRCGCARCREFYPLPARKPTKNCSGSWQARWYKADGTRDSATRSKKDDALAIRTAAVAAIEAGTYKDPKRAAISLREWRATVNKGRRVEDYTQASNDSNWRAHIEPRWGSEPLSSITHQPVQNWTVELECAGLSPISVRAIVSYLSLLMTAARKDGRIDVNPCNDVTISPQKGRPRAPDRPPTRAEVDLIAGRILPAGRGRSKLDIYSRMPRIAAEVGFRWGEGAGLLPDCVDLQDGWIEIRRVLVNVGGRKVLREYPKSEAGFRRIPLTRLATRLFTEQFELQPAQDGRPVFRTYRGAFLDGSAYRNDYFLPATIAAGLHCEVDLPSGRKDHWPTFHHIRHLFASRLENGGVPESIRKLVLGHERPKRDVTWLYTHAPEDPDEYGPIVLAGLGDGPAAAGTAVTRAVRAAS